MTDTTKDLTQRWNTAMMNNYGTPGMELVSGKGVMLTDAAGKDYIDFFSGIAVNSLGQAHPAIVEAVTRQISTLGHVSNIFINPVVVQLAEKLEQLLDVEKPVRAVFVNSGTEANEAALKLARLTGRSRILAAHNGFHGRTMGALSITGQPDKQEPFAPLVPGVEFYPYGDIVTLRSIVEQDAAQVAAIFLEPIQGEAGINEPPVGFLADVRALCDEHGILMICDEVQTGIARTGKMFASRGAGVVPDVITLAKGLGGGLPIGACLGIGAAAELFQPGQHGSTFGGNPVSCAAALAVLETIESEGLEYHAHRLGRMLIAELEMMDLPQVKEVRGDGLLIGIALTQPVAAKAVTAARERGFIIGTAGASVIRITPPLIIEEDHMWQLIKALPEIIADAAEQKGPAA